MSEEIPFEIPNYRFERLLGKGGMASVWLARQISLDRPVAIKILSSEYSTDPEDVLQFRREAQMAAQLSHSGIVAVYDANCMDDGHYYFIMEYVDGYTMGDLLRRKGMLEVEDVLAIGESVAVAMDYAWTRFGMIHCDIKPDNIMVDVDGTVKVTDLGLCRSLVSNREGTASAPNPEGDVEIYGTPAYMSPEQIYADIPLDCRSDVYELGATMYHLLTGRMLFQGKTDDEMVRCHVGEVEAPDPRLLNRMIPNQLVLLLQKMTAKNRAHRPDWTRLLEDFQRIREGRPPYPVLFPPKGSSIAHGMPSVRS